MFCRRYIRQNGTRRYTTSTRSASSFSDTLELTCGQALKPGGLLLLRDYGRHDLTQLRIKKDRLLDPDVPNLYIRGDGTRVYYFDQDDLRGLLTQKSRDGETGKMFEIDQFGEDRRMVSFLAPCAVKPANAHLDCQPEVEAANV